MTELWLLAGFFAFVLGAVSILGYVVMNRMRPAAESEAPEASTLVVPEIASTDGLGFIVRAFQFVGQAFPAGRAENSPLRSRLVAAGYRLPSAVPTFYGVKCAAAMTLGTLGVWLGATFDADMLMPALCGAAFGFMLPDRVLRAVMTSRAHRLRRALPAALDMLGLAVEAGQSIDQALLATSRGLKHTHPDLCGELTILQLETRASNNRVEALRRFAARNHEPELKKFVSLMIDTDRFGSSIGPALRDHAKYLRIRFRQRAQEAARKTGVKLIFPVFFLIFPSVILVTLGPAVIMIFTQLGNMVK